VARSRSNRITEMGELQLEIFERLAALGEATVYDILGALPKTARPKYTTVLTVLRSLEEKGLATHYLRGRTHVFEPVVSVHDVRSQLLRNVLERVFGGSPKRLMTALLDDDAVTPDVVRELRELLTDTEVGHSGDHDGR